MSSRIRLGFFAMCLAATAGLGGCHRKVDDPAAVTPDEQSQLNDAAAMLDANAETSGAEDEATDANASDTNTEDPT